MSGEPGAAGRAGGAARAANAGNDGGVRGAGERVLGMMQGAFVTQALYVATRLGVAELLHGGPMGVRDLAQVVGVDEVALYRMLRALAGEGVFEERVGRVFANNAGSAVLRERAEGSVRASVLLGGETQFKVWAVFRDVVRTGGTGFERIFRKPLFAFLKEMPEVHRLFNAAMTEHMRGFTPKLLAACALRAGERVVDVGGGVGDTLVALLERYPGARGVLYEGQEVIAEARGKWEGHKCLDRMELVEGDFLERVPAGEVMVLAWILHMFQDEVAGRVLRNCRAALSAGGRVFCVERLVRGANVADEAKWEDLNMMVMTGGRERTLEEFRELLEGAGFARVRQVEEGIVVGEC